MFFFSFFFFFYRRTFKERSIHACVELRVQLGVFAALFFSFIGTLVSIVAHILRLIGKTTQAGSVRV